MGKGGGGRHSYAMPKMQAHYNFKCQHESWFRDLQNDPGVWAIFLSWHIKTAHGATPASANWARAVKWGIFPTTYTLHQQDSKKLRQARNRGLVLDWLTLNMCFVASKLTIATKSHKTNFHLCLKNWKCEYSAQLATPNNCIKYIFKNCNWYGFWLVVMQLLSGPE